MSKKKNNGKDDIFELMSKFTDLLSDMSEEQLLQLNDLIANSTKTNELIDSNWYEYQRPNYAKMSGTLAEWLVPLAKAISLEEIVNMSDEVIEKAATMERVQMENDLRNYIYAFLAAANKETKGVFEYSDNLIPLITAFRIMAKYQLTGLLDTVMETLKQKYEISNNLYLEGGAFIGTAIIYELGKNQMEKITEFLNAQGFIPMIKPVAFDALVTIYFLEPKLKLTALHHITTYLQHCYEIGIEGGLMTNIDHYASTLAKANVREALPIMKKIYADCDIPSIEVDGYNDLVHLMNDNAFTLKDSLLTMEQIAEDQKEYISQYDTFDEDYDEDYDDPFEYPEEAPALDEDQEKRCMTLKITLNGTKIPVERTLTIPSNIYLIELQPIMDILADWWSGVTEYEVEKDGILYVEYHDQRHDEDRDDVLYAEDYTLQQLASAPGDTLTLRIWQGGNMHWENTITVVGNRKYKKNEKRLMKLISATGPYPTTRMRTMKGFENKANKGHIPAPDTDTMKYDLEGFEDENF